MERKFTFRFLLELFPTRTTGIFISCATSVKETSAAARGLIICVISRLDASLNPASSISHHDALLGGDPRTGGRTSKPQLL
ncbi:unnamed protein product [Pleuronectes platessa]|uniref:Uncharacterized protein n=1 Tax=Pleuronectes platessa TaxID=8262 RepID=A0A9N7YQU9_PLEPL|nr:unnamed protein product [Pleuronectes platessa]